MTPTITARPHLPPWPAGNIQAAVRFLKVDRLYRLGLATKPQCEAMLCSFNWDVELAASRMLDTM